MKALVLAAGYATRMYPLTESQPKPLLKVGKKTIIEHILGKIKTLKEVDEVFIVTNARFYDLFRVWSNKLSFPKKITLVNDGTISKDDRLGAIGDILFTLRENDVNDDLLIIGGDNLFEDDLNTLIKFFKEKKSSVIFLNDVKNLEAAKLYGIVTLDKDQKIIRFVEKPPKPESTLASTLIYVLKKDHLLYIQEAMTHGFADHTGDFICYLSKKEKIYGFNLKGKWFDIGSLEALKEAEKKFHG